MKIEINYSKFFRGLQELLVELQRERFYVLVVMVVVIVMIVFGGDFMRAIAPNGLF